MRPTPRPTPAPTFTPDAGPLLVNTPTPTATPVRPTPTPFRPPGTSPAGLSAGQARLLGEAHLETFKLAETDTFGASGYLDQTVLPLPPAIEATIAQLAMGWGFYGGANEFFATAGTGRDVDRSMVILLEPRTRLPDDATAAKELLRALFPGAAGRWEELPSASGGFTFTGPGAEAGVVETAGFAISEGLVIAYLASGGDTYANLATALAEATP
jgi:hypothetical protein